MRDIFHVHTYRCNHAEKVSDEAYICKAIEHGAESITFTDHAPFPGDPFFNRMSYSELPEYISTLTELKEKYKDKIYVKIGLEIEFLPGYMEYYKELHQCKEMDVLMIGQHFFEVGPEQYSFSYPELVKRESVGCLNAVIEGINTGLFHAVAHPDRAFRKIESWTQECEQLSKNVIAAAKNNNILLEQNLSSILKEKYYRDEFWGLLEPENRIIRGIDAHSLNDMDKAVIRYREDNIWQ